MTPPSRTKRILVTAVIWCVALSVFVWVNGIGYDSDRGLLTVTSPDQTKTGLGFSINNRICTYHHFIWFADGTLDRHLQAVCLNWNGMFSDDQVPTVQSPAGTDE